MSEELIGLEVPNKKGVTICMITHDLNIAEQTDRVINIYDGQIAS